MEKIMHTLTTIPYRIWTFITFIAETLRTSKHAVNDFKINGKFKL